jgi:hypothetical protein
MRTREKLTHEERFALALDLIKRERSLDEIRAHYRVSHTTAYKVRNAFLEGGRAALGGERRAVLTSDLEARVRALEEALANGRPLRARRRRRTVAVATAPAGNGAGNGAGRKNK